MKEEYLLFTSSAFKTFLQSHAITHHLTTPPDHNGIMERKHHDVIEIIVTPLLTVSIPLFFLGKSSLHCHISYQPASNIFVESPLLVSKVIWLPPKFLQSSCVWLRLFPMVAPIFWSQITASFSACEALLGSQQSLCRGKFLFLVFMGKKNLT